ncbi:MarR family winged helix-turn-helix transcriptional regulator [Actinoplanes sp. CA-142083]|uniref:MarR family winged helix-turn-helix transcriptional regulator n=1 Tax=Actinoplanes sp. CA-142083 TaxID=3239903 RepID=UPI003D92404D
MDDRVTHVAAAVESAVESLVSVLDAARVAQTPTVPPAQLRVLTFVSDNRQTNMSRLAEALDVVPSSASRLCDRLEAAGLLRRVPDPRDRREVRLMLTSSARRLLDQIRERRRVALAEVLDRMPESSREELLRSLRVFAEAAEPAEEETADLRTA